MLNTLFTLAAFTLALMILITVHEFGHFWVARILGIKVLRFCIGFGKPILHRTGKSGTEYVLALFPLGGYVKMLDEREGVVSENEKHLAFNRQPLIKRVAVVIAGPLFNVLFAIFAYWLMFIIGITSLAPVVGKIAPNSIAANAGLQPLDAITSVGSQTTPDWQAVKLALISKAGDRGVLPIKVRNTNDNKVRQLDLNITTWQLDPQQPDPLGSLGITPFLPTIPPDIDTVVPDGPAAKAGLHAGDRIIKIDGRPITEWTDFLNVVKQSAEKSIKLTVERNQQTLELELIPAARTESNGERYGYVGLKVKWVTLPEKLLYRESYNPLSAVFPAIKKTMAMLGLTFLMLWKLFTGSVSLHSISGPVGIAIGAGASASMGFVTYLQFLSLVSLSLAALNVLPIPLLDGGHLFYFLIEGVTRKPVSEKVEMWGMRLGLLFIAALTFIAFYNDIMRLLG